VVRQRGIGVDRVIAALLVLVHLALFAFEQDLATKLAGLLGAILGLPRASMAGSAANPSVSRRLLK
jgi:hypothetical protein